jgi:hypothetical protein
MGQNLQFLTHLELIVHPHLFYYAPVILQVTHEPTKIMAARKALSLISGLQFEVVCLYIYLFKLWAGIRPGLWDTMSLNIIDEPPALRSTVCWFVYLFMLLLSLLPGQDCEIQISKFIAHSFLLLFYGLFYRFLSNTISESSISKYEAYLTDTPLDNWNQNLPLLSIACQIIVSIFLMITAVHIKGFFKCRAKQPGKPRIKNTISFKWLNMIYSIGIIFETILHLILMKNNSKDTFIMHYDTTMAFNLMMIIFVVSNEDAKKFFMVKFKSWKEEQMFNFRRINVVRKSNRVAQLENVTQSGESIALQPLPRSLFVIEAENHVN